ncbi:hypothetical protein EIP91_008278 [Steccherinum ochraceum]|uniref:T6SS Phospholipase effector Tle1-like catalytic domain-containing protein n=1 Tax=Steccherinum ochraceum TaxID=92696 RepID=A0A4R0RGT6_9APHY|nr:hypothetical protein EIP91_008278 [Steccherinum ochraceum]
MPEDSRRIATATSHMTSVSSGDTIYEEDGSQAISYFTSADAKPSTRWSEEARKWIPSPDSKRQRTLVLCFDGTGDQFDSDNSNVVQLVSMLKKDDTTQQLVYYQTGIGTYTDSSFKGPLLSGISEVLDEMLAWNLASHIKAGYAFLMENYTKGDKICIFGFSRGAYTARALAGMLQKVGLLPPHNHQQIQFAYEMFKREDTEGLQLSEMFRRTFCRDVDVEFVGVWDTVASVGIIPHYLPFITENNGIKYLRHALALDERRIKFLPSYCVDPHKKPPTEPSQPSGSISPQKLFQDRVNSEAGRLTNVQEVWFSGVHTDVGGGSVKNDTPHALARIPLRWMVRQCFECNTGLIFDAVMLQQIGMSVYIDSYGQPALGSQPARLPAKPDQTQEPPEGQSSFAWSVVEGIWGTVTYPITRIVDISRMASSHTKHAHLESKRSTLPVRKQNAEYHLEYRNRAEAEAHEAEEERKDSLSPLYDQLAANWVWHILEWIPQRVKKQKAIVKMDDSLEGYTWVWNRGRGRKVYKDEMEEGMLVHRSVRTRLEAGPAFADSERLYWPKVRPHLPTRVHVHDSTDPVRLDYHEWNVDTPEHWKWVN